MSEKTSHDLHEDGLAGLTGRTLKGMWWTFSGTGIRVCLHLLVLSVLARLLSPDEFGIVGAVLIVVGFSNIFAEVGVAPSLIQRPEIQERHLRTALAITLLLGSLCTALLLLLAPAVAAFFRIEGLAPLLRGISPVFLINGIAVIPEALLQRELKFGRLAAARVLSFTLGYGASGIALALMGLGVWALLAGHMAEAILKVIILMAVQPYPKRPALESRAFRELVYFAGGFTAARIAAYVAGQGDNLVVGRWLGAEALGFYGRAYQLMAMPAKYFDQAVSKVMFPSMSLIQENQSRLGSTFKRGIALTALITLSTSAMAAVLGREIVFVLLGSQWEAVVLPFQIMALGIFFQIGSKFSNSVVRAKGAVYRLSWLQALYAGAVVLGAWLAYPYGVSAVALAVMSAIIFQFVLFTRLSLKITALSWTDMLKALAPAARLGVGVLLLSWFAAEAARGFHMPGVVVLLLTTGVVGSGIAGLVILAPVQVLGKDGDWFLQMLRTAF